MFGEQDELQTNPTDTRKLWERISVLMHQQSRVYIALIPMAVSSSKTKNIIPLKKKNDNNEHFLKFW